MRHIRAEGWLVDLCSKRRTPRCGMEKSLALESEEQGGHYLADTALLSQQKPPGGITEPRPE